MTQARVLTLVAVLTIAGQMVFAQKNYDLEPKIIVKSLAPKKESIPNIYFKNGNHEFTIGGKAKVENCYEKNTVMLNGKLPDENFYFKHELNLTFDMVYGREKFNHKAVEAFLNLRHKSTWGAAQSYADRDSGSSDKAYIQVADAFTGAHSHYSGKNLPWINEAWLQASFNAIFNLKQENVHSIKLGWFPFELGRGIALGTWYGTNRGMLGLYTYDKDDKYVPGINISGQLIKDKFTYDLYFGKMEERSKSFTDNINFVHQQWLDYNGGIPWRGTHKDNDLYAARLKWNTFKNENNGTLDLEPYIIYENGRDTWQEGTFDPDQNIQFGTYGIGAEYAWKNLEFGAEIATNYGNQKVVALDRNDIVLKRNPTSGAVTEYYDHIVTADPNAQININTDPTNAAKYVGQYYRTAGSNYATPPLATVIAAGKTAASIAGDATKNGMLITPGYWNDGISQATITAANANPNGDEANLIYETPTRANRFRPAFTNKLNGWMLVTDAAYKLPNYNLKFAISYSYASGDAAPYENEVNKNYKGFVGINESYSGKRVPSVLLLDKRFLKIPTSLTRNSDDLEADSAFTDMHVFGGGATWSPFLSGKKININPNMLFFWKDSTSKKVIITSSKPSGWEASKTENARKYMGSELNLITDCEIIKDLKLFGKFATFIPGGFFEDVAGVPLDDDFFRLLGGAIPDGYQPKDFRLGHDIAYHANIGLEYKF